MSAAKYTIEIDQGTNWGVTIVWNDDSGVPKDLSGYTGRMQIRTNYTEQSSIVAELTSNTGEVVVNDAPGTITLSLTAEQTADIPVDLTQEALPPKAKYVYDLELVSSDGYVTRLLYGNCTVTAEVTR